MIQHNERRFVCALERSVTPCTAVFVEPNTYINAVNSVVSIFKTIRSRAGKGATWHGDVAVTWRPSRKFGFFFVCASIVDVFCQYSKEAEDSLSISFSSFSSIFFFLLLFLSIFFSPYATRASSSSSSSSSYRGETM